MQHNQLHLCFLSLFSPSSSLSLPSSIKPPCCICFLFGSYNLQLQLVLKACCNFASQRKNLQRLSFSLQTLSLTSVRSLLCWAALLEPHTESLAVPGLLLLQTHDSAIFLFLPCLPGLPSISVSLLVYFLSPPWRCRSSRRCFWCIRFFLPLCF